MTHGLRICYRTTIKPARLQQFYISCVSFCAPLLQQLALISPNGEQYDSLLRQLRDRMEEGCGETIYVVGMGSGETKLKCSLYAVVTHFKRFWTGLFPLIFQSVCAKAPEQIISC